MTDFPISVSPSRMGRPKLDVKPMLVRLPAGATERIDQLVGLNKRAEFIREAIAREIQRRERIAVKKPSEPSIID